MTFKELMTLANAGITHLRIPVGYWILGPPYLYSDEPYVTGGWYYLERALGWCKQLGLKAVIDLHGAPGIVLVFTTISITIVAANRTTKFYG